MARYGKQHKEATRRRIVEMAGRRLKADGIDGSGVATLMADAGLTNGAFYAHFASKEDLVAAAVADQLRAQRVQYSTQPPGRDGVELMVREYLSAAHRDSPQDGCPSAALLAEIGRCGDATRRAYTEGVLAIAGEIAGRLAPDDPPSARGTTLGLFALLIGTMQLSRALADRELADEVLEQGLRNALVLTDAGERASRTVLRAGRPIFPGGLRRAGRSGVRCPQRDLAGRPESVPGDGAGHDQRARGQLAAVEGADQVRRKAAVGWSAAC